MAKPPPSSQTISDQQRQDTEQQLATALLLLYAGHRQKALAALGVDAALEDLPPGAIQKVQAFASERAQKIQDGVNSRMLGTDDPEAMAQSIADHNTNILQPFMESWAANNALIDAYQETPATDGKGSAADQAQWEWTRYTANPPDDECEEAMGMSPASLDALFSVTGGPPPLHNSCQCSLNPA